MKRTSFLVSLVLLVCVAAFVSADEKKGTAAKAPGHTMFAPAEIQWTDAPPILPAGAKAAVLDGDPSKPGIFTMRLKVPDGYRIMPHWHPVIERVTVLSGALNIGFGDNFDEASGHAMPAGTYATMAPKVHHFAWATGETEIQLTTNGPWALIYVNPEDDPSKK
jgi:Domain of unknown function (DUF4437)